MLNTESNCAADLKIEFSMQAGENIGYEKGARLAKNYYDQNNEQVSEHFIGREMIEALLAQPGAVGINIIAGADKKGNLKPVLVGVNAHGSYILNITSVDGQGELKKEKGIVATTVISPGGVGMPTGW